MTTTTHTLIKPKRGYQLLVAGWIASICMFIAVMIAIDRQYTFGEPNGALVVR